MTNQYIINELCKEAAYHANAYQEKIAALNNISATEKTAADSAAVADAVASNPGMLQSLKGYFTGDASRAGLINDLKYLYQTATSKGYSPEASVGSFRNALSNFALKQHPYLTAGAVAAPVVAGLGTAYGLGAFDGQPSPEEMAAEEMAKQSSYNPNVKTAADAATVADVVASNPGMLQSLKGYFSGLGQDFNTAFSGIPGYLKGEALGYPSTYLDNLTAAGRRINRELLSKHPYLTAGAVAAPLVAGGLGAAYGLGAFDGQPSPEEMAAAEMAKQSSYNPNVKTAADAAAVADAVANNPGMLQSLKGYFSGLGQDFNTAFSGIPGYLKGEALGYPSTYLDNLTAAGRRINRELLSKHPYLTAGAVAAPVVAGLGTAYGLGAFDGQPSPEEMAAAEMAKQSSYNPNTVANQSQNTTANQSQNTTTNQNIDSTKVAAYNNLVNILQRNPEFKQMLMNM